jgi:dipeptide/tripeptide permease
MAGYFFFVDIIIIYLHEELGFDMDISTSIYHISELLTYVFPTFAAIIAGEEKVEG